ncbi:penicillin-binding protein 1C, partial [Leptospira stimsonii]
MSRKNIWVIWFISIFFYSNVLFSENVPAYEAVRDSYQSSDGTLLDIHGRFLQTIRFDTKERRLAWVEEGEIPETLFLALLLQEDKRFFEHSGVDSIAIFGAVRDRLLGTSKRGASTLSMQLAGMFLRTKPGRRTFLDKWNQIQFAREMEESWKKTEILTAYLNLTSFRGELKGLRSASRGIFHKEPSALSDTEAILLVSMLPFPGAGAEVLARRSCILAKKLRKDDLCSSFEKTAKIAVSKPTGLPSTGGIAYHAAQKFFRENFGSSLKSGKERTTIDFDLQWKITERAKNILDGLKSQNVAETGVVVLDNVS